MTADTALPARWINAHAFGARVLRGGEEPWSVPEQLGLYCKELSRWLSLDWIDVDAEAAIRQWVAGQSASCATADDVIDLLESEALMAVLREGLASVVGGSPGAPVALSLPGSGRLIRELTGEDAEDEDALDDVTVALTGLLREIHVNELAGVLVHEDDSRALAYYTPLLNVARHYQAPLWLAFAGSAGTAEGAGDFAGVYDRSGTLAGRYLDAAAWAEAPQAASSIYTRIPESLSPDEVLGWLGRLRGE